MAEQGAHQIDNVGIFEREEKVRQRTQDPQRQERLEAAPALMGEIFDGRPTFIDVTVIEDTSSWDLARS